MCCLLRPDLPLRGQHLSLCNPHVPLCTPTSPTPSSQHPLCAPLFPITPCFSPLTGLHCPSITVPCGLCLFRAGLSKILFFAKTQIEIIGFVCYTVSAAATHLGCCSTKTGKDNTSANGCFPIKLPFQNQVVAILIPQAVVCQLFSEHGG